MRQRLETLHLMSPPAGWTGTVTLVPAQEHTCVCVYAVLFGSTANCQFNLADSDGNAISGQIFGLADMSMVLEQNANFDPWYITPRGKGLQMVVTAGPVYGDIYWLRVPDYLPPASVT
jgi:hypothetical protein